MTSSMLTGERRWASSTRRSGMTVLGKVAVPKPINLPSQRLENNGLDPNVEIVPKGTASWGSRTSQLNAWGSSALSPKTDGSTGSPRCPSGHASSGGSNTRPSTAGSDRSQEATANSWGPSSRPLSASGALSSNQSSLALLRPRSAETRPGSSQKSRFAEPLSENSVSWGGTAEKMGAPSSRNAEFSLSSGDFPTLGSEKENSGENTNSQDHNSHGRPSSSTGASPVKERSGTSGVGNASMTSNIKNGDEASRGEDGARSGLERWQGDGHPFPSASMTPQHYDAWHGPQLNNLPGGVWYRGPPYGAPVPPGSYPVEPFPYYRPRISATLPNPQPGPPQGAVPRGAPIPDPCIRPGMPFQPGFYPPPVPYEGYYGPPMGYCNPNERDIPYMGMAATPVYSRYPSQNASDPGNLHARPSIHGPASKSSVSDRVELDRPHDNRGPYKVLLKQHNGWDEKKGQKWGNHAASNTVSMEKGGQQRRLWGDDSEVEHKKEAKFDSQTQDSGCPRSSSVSATVNIPATVENLKQSDATSAEKSVCAGSSVEVPQSFPTAPKGSSLIQKIEGLNAKARASDARNDIAYEHGADSVFIDETQPIRISRPVTSEAGISFREKSLETKVTSGPIISRSTPMHGRNHNRGKGRLNNSDVDSFGKKSPVENSSNMSAGAPLGSAACVSVEAAEKPGFYPQRRYLGGPTAQKFDSNDEPEQHQAKMRMLAKQHSKQLQQEEEEHVAKQKAKAHEKLELNRRTPTVETSHQKEENILGDAVQKDNKQGESRSLEPKMSAGRTGSATSASASIQNVVAPIAENNARTEKPVLTEPSQRRPNGNYLEPPMGQIQIGSLQQGAVNVNAGLGSCSRVHDSKAFKHRGLGYKQNQSGFSERNLAGNITPSRTIEASENHSNNSVNMSAPMKGASTTTLSCESSLAPNWNAVPESSVQQNRRNNRAGRNKHKVEEGPTMASVSVASTQRDITNTVVETGRSKSSETELAVSSAQPDNKFKDANQSTEQKSYVPNEEIQGKIKNQWRSHHPHRTPRNPQGNRSSEKFHDGDAVVWAPVRPRNKTEAIDETSQEGNATSGKNDHQVQNNPKNKRAEMERYVPKPIAKEMAQQGSKQQSVVPSASQSSACEATGRVNFDPQVGNSRAVGTGIGKVESGMDSKVGGGMQNTQVKARGFQRQQYSDFSHVQGPQDGSSYTSNPCGDIPKSVDFQLSQKPEMLPLKEQAKHSNECDASDGCNMRESSGSIAPTSIIPDRATVAKGKRYSHKQHRGTGNTRSFDKKFSRGDNQRMEEHNFAAEMIQTEWPAAKEARGFAEASMSHWQPKPQGGSNQGGGGNSVGAEVQPNKRESQPQGRMPQQQHKGTATAEPSNEQIVLQRSSLEEVPDQDKSDSKRSSSRGPTTSSSRTSAGIDESSFPATVDSGHEQRPSSGYRKSGNQNNRFGRGPGSRGEWASSVQGHKQHNPSGNRFRQRHNTHYEYQPVNNRSNEYEGSKDNSHNTGVGHRERVQSHSKHRGGNFHGNQIQVDGGNDS